jgi:ferritin-like metal-binding protein YciE
VYLPERAVLAVVNAWIGDLFDNEHRAATAEQLAAAESSTSDNARMEQARNKLLDTEKRIRRLQQAIEAGANPALSWMRSTGPNRNGRQPTLISIGYRQDMC